MADNNRNQYNQNWNQDRDRSERYDNYNESRNWQDRNRLNENYNNASYNSYGDRGWSERFENDNNYNYGTPYQSSSNWGNSYENDQRWRNRDNRIGNQYNTSADRNNWNDRTGFDNKRDSWDRTRDEVSSWFGNDDAERRREMDKRVSGEHRGKGPRGYVRSDSRIREDVNDRLSDDPYVDASDLDVKVENSEVVISGHVADREQKRRAEDLAERVAGVRNVENRIRVDRDRDEHHRSTMGDYTGNSDNVGNIGDESGTTNEIIRNAGRGKREL